MSYYAEQIAEWVVSLKPEVIPKNVLDIAKKCLTDWIGVTIYGSLSPWSQTVASIVKEEGGKQEATIMADGFRLPAAKAALVNGIMSLGYDMSDTFLDTALHPSCATISAALATAEREKTSGKALLTAIVAGYEVNARVARALNPKRLASGKGFESNALIPAFGATVAAGKLFQLDEKQTANAIGICSCSLTGGLIEYLLDGNWTYRWNGGRGGHDGILNSLVAQRGFIGPLALFEGHWDNKGRYGLVNALTGSVESAAETVKDLGNVWNLNNLGFKYYACCHYIHGFIDGVLKLIKQESIKTDDIEEITCFLPHMTLFLAVPRRVKVKPANLTIAQWSLPFCLATAITDGHLLNPSEQLSQERLNHAGVLALSERIKGEVKEELNTLAEKGDLVSPFRLRLRNGKVYEGQAGCKGFTYNPLTKEEHELKFNTLVSHIYSKEKTAGLYDVLNRIEEMEELSKLVDLLGKW